jgi:hypothetical protein
VSETPRGVSPVLQINSLNDLFGHEKEILRRIDETVNGPNLFVIDPLRMLADVGVELSKEARQALLHHEPSLAYSSVTAYEALKKTKEPQRVRFHLKGLFRKPQ